MTYTPFIQESILLSSLEDEAASSRVALLTLESFWGSSRSVNLGAKGRRNPAFVIACAYRLCMDATPPAPPT
jgi:hypothetical protein